MLAERGKVTCTVLSDDASLIFYLLLHMSATIISYSMIHTVLTIVSMPVLSNLQARLLLS